MKKASFIILLVVTSFYLSNFLHAQEEKQEERSRIGIGVSLGKEIVEIGEAYTMLDFPSFYLPINLSSNLRFEPEIGYLRYSGSDADWEESYTILSIGCGIFSVIQKGRVDIYYGARLGLMSTSYSYRFTWDGVDSVDESNTDFYIGPAIEEKMANVSINARKNRSGDSPITQEQREKIQKARDDAFKLVKKGLKNLDNIWNQSSRKRLGRRKDIREKRKKAWRTNTEVVRWFGRDRLTTGRIRRTRKRLIRIKKEFEGTLRFTIIQHQTGDRSWLCKSKLAYCFPGTPIKLCPLWFQTLSPKEKAITIVHELSHKNGHIDHRGAKDYKSAKQLAENHPKLARKNPENFAQFCGEYWQD